MKPHNQCPTLRAIASSRLRSPGHWNGHYLCRYDELMYAIADA